MPILLRVEGVQLLQPTEGQIILRGVYQPRPHPGLVSLMSSKGFSEGIIDELVDDGVDEPEDTACDADVPLVVYDGVDGAAD